MRKRSAILLCIVMFAAGASAGAWYSSRSLGALLHEIVPAPSTVSIYLAVRTLEALRLNEVQAAIETLERRVDAEVLALDAAEGVPNTSAGAMTFAAVYRGKHPRNSGDPQYDQSVARVLKQFERK
ncbi:MAG: hypothetical protein KF738_14245 [Burkholderiales bacterium]|nr:hypothetical protein [Burkholderiales bacterium]